MNTRTLTRAAGRLWLAIYESTRDECLKTRASWEMRGLAESLEATL